MAGDRFDIKQALPVGDGEHVVVQGECIYSLAARSGHDWKTIWNHPNNAALKHIRKDPGILLPGDRVHIPDIKPKTVELSSGRRHRIVVAGQKIDLHLRMCDADGAPIANAKYQLLIGNRRLPGTTNHDGQLVISVPAEAAEARLQSIETGETYSLHLGQMDPPETPSAVRKRLVNLGYNLEEVDGQLDEHSLSVLRGFCEDAEVGETEREEVVKRLQEKDPWSR